MSRPGDGGGREEIKRFGENSLVMVQTSGWHRVGKFEGKVNANSRKQKLKTPLR
jgi:hypothetical protein